VLLGALVMVVVPLGGIAWGISAVQQSSTPEQGPASAGLVLGVLFGLLLGGGYAVTERLRRGSFFLDDPAEVERNRQRGRFNWSYVGIGLLVAATLRFLPLRLDFLLGGALCGVMLAWAPLGIAAYLRLRLRRRTAPAEER
jgi:hypothetical protein